MKTNEVYGKYTFQPKIDKVSKALAEDHRRDLLENGMSNFQAKDKFAQRHEKYIAEKEASCTFKPEVYSANLRKFDTVPSTVGPDGPLTSQQEKIRTKLKARHQKIAAERRQRELEELKECTFKPLTNDFIADNSEEVVIVKGLGRHLELQELKRRQEEDKRLREAEVFGVNHKFAVNAAQYDISNPDRNQLMASQASLNPTVPMPFNLSQARPRSGYTISQ